jgi:hypothetical protein
MTECLDSDPIEYYLSFFSAINNNEALEWYTWLKENAEPEWNISKDGAFPSGAWLEKEDALAFKLRFGK